MQITRTSPWSNEVRIREIDVTQEQLYRIEAGASIQVVLPHLSPSDREFIKSGITDEKWDAIAPDEDNEPVDDLHDMELPF